MVCRGGFYDKKISKHLEECENRLMYATVVCIAQICTCMDSCSMFISMNTDRFLYAMVHVYLQNSWLNAHSYMHAYRKLGLNT